MMHSGIDQEQAKAVLCRSLCFSMHSHPLKPECCCGQHPAVGMHDTLPILRHTIRVCLFCAIPENDSFPFGFPFKQKRWPQKRKHPSGAWRASNAARPLRSRSQDRHTAPDPATWRFGWEKRPRGSGNLCASVRAGEARAWPF